MTRKEGRRYGVMPPVPSLQAAATLRKSVDRSGRLHWGWALAQVDGKWLPTPQCQPLRSLADAATSGFRPCDPMWNATPSGSARLRSHRFSTRLCRQHGFDWSCVAGFSRDFDAWQWPEGHPTTPVASESLTQQGLKKRQHMLDEGRGTVAPPISSTRRRDMRRGLRPVVFSDDANADDPFSRCWSRPYVHGKGKLDVWMLSSYYTGRCHHPAHPKVRSWNLYIQIAAGGGASCNHGVVARGRKLWARRELVRVGKVDRGNLVWDPEQPAILDYDKDCVVYAIVPKRGDNRVYVGVTAMDNSQRQRGAWGRHQHRLHSVFFPDGRVKQKSTRSSERTIESSLSRRGLQAVLQDYYVMVLEHIPKLSSEETSDMWRKRVQPYERFWIHFLNASAEGGGFNIEHTKARKALSARRRAHLSNTRHSHKDRGFHQKRVAQGSTQTWRPMLYRRQVSEVVLDGRATDSEGSLPTSPMSSDSSECQADRRIMGLTRRDESPSVSGIVLPVSIPPSPPPSDSGNVSPPLSPPSSPQQPQGGGPSPPPAPMRGLRRSFCRRDRRNARRKLDTALKQEAQGVLLSWVSTLSRNSLRLCLRGAMGALKSDALNESQIAAVKRVKDAVTARSSDVTAPRRTRESRSILVAAFCGRVTELLKLPSIVADPMVMDSVHPSIWQDVGAPMVVFKYYDASISQVGNWSYVACSASNVNEKCDCHLHRYDRFRHPTSGHVVTKDLSIISSDALRMVLSKGPTFRMRTAELLPTRLEHPTLQERIVEIVDSGLESFIKCQEERFDIPPQRFSEWSARILSAVNKRVKEATEADLADFQKWLDMHHDDNGWPPGALSTLRTLQKKYVFAVADKETGAYTVTCKQHWIQTMQ